MASDTSDLYHSHPYLHPGVPLPAALVLLADETSFDVDASAAACKACSVAGITTFGPLLREGAVARLRLRSRHKKDLRRSIHVWKRRHMRPPTKGETQSLWRLAKDGAACERTRLAGHSNSLTWAHGARGATVLDLSDGDEDSRSREPLGLALLRTALDLSLIHISEPTRPY